MMRTHFPFFSVVVPLYRAEATLRQTAQSLVAAEASAWEAILVDDASPDGTRQVAEAIVRADSRFRLVPHPQNRGTHRARKTGVEAARGRWILFLDSDDAFVPGSLALLEKALLRIGFSADLVRFDTTFRHPELTDPALSALLERYRCRPDRRSDGPAGALSLFFTGKNAPLYLWSFAVRSDVCKAAFARTDDRRLVYAEDAYEIFALAAEAASYRESPVTVYRYDNAAGGITGWRNEKGRSLSAYVGGYGENLRHRIDSFVAVERLAHAFQGPRHVRATVGRALRNERRRILFGLLPYERSFLAAQGVPVDTLRRLWNNALSPLCASDRVLLHTAHVLRRVAETLGLLPRPERIAWMP